MPEFLGIAKWINIKTKVTRKSLSGKVVLIEFWNYSDVRSQRRITYLNAWYDKYHVEGFEIIGIHSPLYSFEKAPENVLKAVQNLKIQFPVALDPEYRMWKAYNNHDRPASYLIDGDGRIRSARHGEGNYEEEEKLILDLLKEKGPDPELELEQNKSPLIPAQASIPRITFGYKTATQFGNNQRILAEESVRYRYPEEIVLNNFYLEGVWKFEEERVKLSKAPGSLKMRFKASAVYIVISSPSDSSMPMEVKLDGIPLSKETKGAQIVFQTGKSFCLFKEAGVYELINTSGLYEEHTLELHFEEPKAEIYELDFA